MESRSLSFNLEPTFRCNLGCEMCPRFSSEDPHLDMSMDTYRRIVEEMECAHTVDFTGWGEPMLHRNLYDMVRTAKEAGCLTTMTSNGTVLTEKNCLSLIEAGMDRLTVSVDGMRPKTYDAIRTGACFERITENLRTLCRLVEKQGGSLELGIAFTLQEINSEDLEAIVPWMKFVGARVLHLKHLNVVSNTFDWDRSFLKYRLHPARRNGGFLARLEERIAALRKEAEEADLRFHMHSESPLTSELRARHCLATPLDSLYFSYEGRVAPCCHFGHHVSRYFEGEYIPPFALFYGDIRRQPLKEIWESAPYQEFRRAFGSKAGPDACRSCYLLYGK